MGFLKFPKFCKRNSNNPFDSVRIFWGTCIYLYLYVSDQNQNSLGQNRHEGFLLPNKAFFTLPEACSFKALNYKTACNKRVLQPNKGVPYGKLEGRKVWGYKSIALCITQLDELDQVTG